MSVSEQPEELPTRWEVELEFVQSLANIQYVNWLAQNEYLADRAFINYLKYLNYWKQPQYAKYVVYPDCLHVLTLLQNEEFRKSIVNPELINTLMNDMVKRWQNLEETVEAGTEPKEDGKLPQEKSGTQNLSEQNSTAQISETPSINVEHSS